MKINSVVLLFLLTPPLFAQTTKIDSLQKLLKNAVSDTVRVNLMADIGIEYWASDPEKTIVFSQKALDSARKIKYIRGEAKSYQGIGIYHWQKNDYQKALISYEQSKKLYEGIGDRGGAARSISNIGMIYGEQEIKARR
jgi:tetratricopeptide (TPR) repeat protein